MGAFPGLTPNTLQVGRKPKLTALSNLILVYICSTLYCISRQCFSIPCIRFLRDKIRREPLELQRTYLFINLFKLLDTLRSHCIKHGSRKRWWLQKHERQCVTLLTGCSSFSQEWSCDLVRGRRKEGLDTSKELLTCTHPSEPLGHARCALATQHCWAPGEWGWSPWTDMCCHSPISIPKSAFWPFAIPASASALVSLHVLQLIQPSQLWPSLLAMPGKYKE